MTDVTTTNPLLVDACWGRSVHRTPVWIMRQAGRYLPEYRAIRKNYTFTEMYKNPELAAEVTLQPIELIGTDGAIIFSDILVIPEAMGMDLEFVPGKGPVFASPLESEKDVANLAEVDADEKLSFVMDALRLVRKELADETALIGFTGAPWTNAVYMVEGRGTKRFSKIKKWRYARPDLLHQLLAKVTAATIDYARAQIRAGAQVLQIFDSWAGVLDVPGFEEFALNYSAEIITALKDCDVPIVYFAKGAGVWLDRLNKSGAQVIALDWTVEPDKARKILGDEVVLQGNLDPTALYGSPEDIERRTIEMLDKFGSPDKHVANLGHGILPDISPDHAKAYVEAVKKHSRRKRTQSHTPRFSEEVRMESDD